MLRPKALEALSKNGHQLVIANLLQTRKDEVLFVDNEQEKLVLRDEGSSEIEVEMIAELVQRHRAWLEHATANAS